MADRRFQFRLRHLIAVVFLSAIAVAVVRELHGHGDERASPIVWVSLGIGLGHIAATRLIAWLEQDSQSKLRSIVVIGVFLAAWGVVVELSIALIFAVTADFKFAIKSAVWLATGLLICSSILYARKPVARENRNSLNRGNPRID